VRKSFCPYLPSHCSEVTEICHMALTAHALEGVEVRLKSVGNEWHITLEDEKVFRPYFPPHCSGVTEKCHEALPVHTLRTVHIRL
jgi:hypothetical protein